MIAILLATYNGERYLQAQLDSILVQTYTDWQLFCHDDGSEDGTIALLADYANRYSGQVFLLDYPSQGGAYANFMSLLERVEADYYMFCDQDDVWHEDKILKSVEALSVVEQQYQGRPVIVHSDLRVIDGDGCVIETSFWDKAGIRPDMFKTFSHRISNVVTGCTMLFNQEARHAALHRMPAGKPLHDEWVTLCACGEGGLVIPLHEQLVDYRQHTANTLGAAACYQQKTIAWYLTHFKEIFQENLDNYRVLRSAGYGSWITYLVNKIRNMYVYRLQS